MSVLVPFVHTSAASVPKPVRVREPAAHTLAGIEVIDEAIDESVEPSEVEAVSTVASVFAFMTAASDEDAIPTRVSVFALIAVWLLVMAEPRDEVAVCTSNKVARVPDVRLALVRERVPYAQTSAAVSPPPPETAEIARSMLFAST